MSSLQCPVRSSPLSVRCKNVIFCRHYGVAREPTLGVGPLRRLIRLCAGPERLGRGIVLKLGISPSAAVREPLAILHHEINIMKTGGNQGLAGFRNILCSVPVYLPLFGPAGEGLPVTRKSCLVASNHRGFSEEHSNPPAIAERND